MIRNKKILLAISGSIAAYKAPMLVRLLKKAGADVQVVVTPDAVSFVTPLTLSTLSDHPVHSEFVLNESGEWTNHVALALWADLIVIAPATANTLAKMEQGICDNLLLAVYLSAKSPVLFAPAMDLDMYKHESTQKNIHSLIRRGNILIPAETGFLASGLEGEGRMAEPETIVENVESYFSKSQNLIGKKALVTAGPTYEAIDPVRFIGNHSSGKMGIALAESLAEKGAEVYLICGPTNISLNQLSLFKNIHITRITTSDEMYEQAISIWPQCDIGIMAAAVADYKPEQIEPHKIKKNEPSLTLTLVKTKDILSQLGKEKKTHQYLVGFALETDNEVSNATDKLKKKNLDSIVLNSLKDSGAGFGVDTNRVTLINYKQEQTPFPLLSKKETADKIIDYISHEITAYKSNPL